MKIFSNNKIIFIILIICLFIGTLENKSYAYTQEEILSIIEFTEVEEEPSDADVVIDAQDLIEVESFPVIQTSIESMLYGNEGLIDIDFLTNDSTNTDSRWLTIQSIVQNVFNATTTLAAAAMLTLLIYEGISLVTQRNRNVDDPRKDLKKKLFFEQWVVSLALIAVMAFIINIAIAFSNVIISYAGEVDEDDYELLIYVKNSNVNPYESSSGTINYTFKTSAEGLLMFQSQYDWSLYSGKNYQSIIAGFFLTIFKIALYVVMLIRMFAIAVLVALVPIVIVINALMKMNQRRGILSKWFILFGYCILLKPLISFVYYIMVTSNVSLIKEVPLFFLVVIVVEVAVLIISFIGFKNLMSDKGKRV